MNPLVEKKAIKKKSKPQVIKELVNEVKKPLDLFEHLNNLTNNKVEYDTNNELQTKNYKQFTINRFVSMCDLYLPWVNEINCHKYPDKIHYQYYLSTLPKRKQFFKYISKEKDDTKESKETVARYFEVGFREAEQYLTILTKDQINEINKKFKGGNQ